MEQCRKADAHAVRIMFRQKCKLILIGENRRACKQICRNKSVLRRYISCPDLDPATPSHFVGAAVRHADDYGVEYADVQRIQPFGLHSVKPISSAVR